jgi:hypothetical protein
VDQGQTDVLGTDDAADDRRLVPAGPFDRQGPASWRGLHQDGRRPPELEGQPEIEAHPGIETVRRERSDLGDEVVKIGALGGLPLPFDPQDERERGVPGRRDDQARPAGRIQGPDVRLLPGIEDLSGKRERRGEEKAEG